MSGDNVQELIYRAMQQAFPAHDERVSHFYHMQEYHLGWRDEDLAPTQADGGKLIRPRLCVLACEAVGGDPRQAVALAAAIQLLHDFSLIHDDIQDHSPTRRGRPTVWSLWGEAQAINAGDGMFTAAQLALLQLASAGIDAATTVEIFQRFNQTMLRICEGQYLDISFEKRLDINEADYLAMISRKTAALIAASTGLGAILGNGEQQQTVGLFNFGEALGLAFQIEDDILGIWGDEAVTGKPNAHDIWGRKKSLPIIHALNHAEAADAAQLREYYQQPELNEAQVATIIAILDRTGSRGYTSGVARYYHEQALQALDAVVDGRTKPLGELRSIAQKLLGRAR